jgi:hypothetical protein
VHDVAKRYTLYKEYLARRNAVICNDVFSDDFEETRAVSVVQPAKPKDYYDSPYEIPAVRNF